MLRVVQALHKPIDHATAPTNGGYLSTLKDEALPLYSLILRAPRALPRVRTFICK